MFVESFLEVLSPLDIAKDKDECPDDFAIFAAGEEGGVVAANDTLPRVGTADYG